MKLMELLADLHDEHQSLDGVVSALTSKQWSLPTPSPRWTVSDQIGHLNYFDKTALLAVTDPAGFARAARGLLEASRAGDTAVDAFTLGDFRRLPTGERLRAWRRDRMKLTEALSALGGRDRIGWYGPSMSARSFATARLMEAWAHGQDVCDTVAVQRRPTDRLRHIAQLGYITRAWSYINRGLEVPDSGVTVELTAPSGVTWTWGEPADPAGAAGSSVRGTALDFCLVVTQRRHLRDTTLEVTGRPAQQWLQIAQAFAGPATDGPAPRYAIQQ